MKRLILFTVLISGLTMAGFFGGKKVCTMMQPENLGAGRAWHSQLGLNSGQTEAFDRMEVSFRKEADALCARVCRERADLLQAMKEEKMESAAVDKKIEEIGRLQVLLEKKVASHILNVGKILTPAQRKTYLDKIDRQQCQMMGAS